jgi:hypothetical protein
MRDKKIKKIGWKLASSSFDMASVRYRGLYPAVALQWAGVESRVFWLPKEENLQDLDVLVIVKSFKPDDLLLVQKAAERGIRVVFELCDNIFIEGYNGKSQAHILETFRAISIHLDAITVTTQPLADAVAKEFPSLPVYIVPDAFEDESLLTDAARLLSDAVASERRNAKGLIVRKLKEDLWQLIYKGPRVYKTIVKYWIKTTLSVCRKLIRLLLKKCRNLAIKKLARAKYSPSIYAKKIVWFGNHGASYAQFGMLDLLAIKNDLETVAKEFDVELVVVSNNYPKYVKHIQPLAIPNRYVEWSQDVISSCLASATLVVVPNSLDAFSLCKSANRTVLALQNDVPVVATPTPALEPLAEHIHLADPLIGMRKYLRDSVAGRKDARRGAQLAQQLFDTKAVAKRWREVLDIVMNTSALSAPMSAQVVVVLNLIQDLDLALPVIQALNAEQPQSVLVLISLFLVKESPRVLTALVNEGVPFKVVSSPEIEKIQMPETVKALLTVAETNLGPHRFSRLLTEKVKSKGVYTATMQHGFENVGLTYSDSEHPIHEVNFSAEKIFIWGGSDSLHQDIPLRTREKCVSVGCTKPSLVEDADLSALIPNQAIVVGVFENLHWKRYSEAYRTAFLDAIQTVSDAFPEIVFLVKPHHAGRWLSTRRKEVMPEKSNLIIADPQAFPWESYTASALIGRMSAVITTPSTVAFDAARKRLPTAVFSYDLDLQNYKPLRLLASPQEMLSFVQDSRGDEKWQLQKASQSFVGRVLSPGDAARSIALDLLAAS